MVNYTALGKSIKFLFLPTLTLLVLACFVTFSFSTPFTFIVSDSDDATMTRLFILLVEVGLTIYMYFYYLSIEEEIVEKQRELELINKVGETEEIKWEDQKKFDSVWNIFPGTDDYSTTYSKHKINDNLIIIKKHA